jgi:peptide/nickel transport system substrate-binding protein
VRRTILYSILALATLAFLVTATACGTPTAAPEPTEEPTSVPAEEEASPTAEEEPSPTAEEEASPTAEEETGTAMGGTLRVASKESFNKFNPYVQVSLVDYYVTRNVFDNLVTYDSNFDIQPMLAESWETPDDNTWVFNLRDDVTFHDGTKFDAEAAKFSLDHFLDGAYGEIASRVEEVNVIDSTTLEIKTSEPFPALLYTLAWDWTAIVSPTAWEELGETEFGQAPVGSGPFMFDSWDAGNKLTLKANPDYWRTDENGQAYPYVDEVVFSIRPDRAGAVAALMSGDVDLIAEISPSLAPQLEAADMTNVSMAPTFGWQYFFLNTQEPPFDDVHKRRAVQLALNRQAIVEGVARGFATPLLGPYPPQSLAYDPSIEEEGFYSATPDLERAREELEAAGVPDGFEFTLTYAQDLPWSNIAPVVQAQLAEVGITVNLDGREIGAVLDDMFASNFEALLIDWSGRPDPDFNVRPFYVCEGVNNFALYCDEEVDQILREAGRTIETEARVDLYHSAQSLINEDAPIILLYSKPEIKATRTYVKGYDAFGDDRVLLFNVSLDK